MLASYRDRVYLITFYRHAKHLAVASYTIERIFHKAANWPHLYQPKKNPHKFKRWSHLAEIAGKRDVSELFRLVKVAPGVLQVLAKVVPAQGELAGFFVHRAGLFCKVPGHNVILSGLGVFNNRTID